MRSKVARVLTSLAVSAAIFALLLVAMRTSADSSMVMLAHFFGLGNIHENTILELLALMVAVLAYFAVNQLLSNRLNKAYWKVLGGVYGVCFVSIVMLKSVGVREFNLDFSDILLQLIEYPVSVGMNFLLFVPLGAFVALRLKSLPKAVLLGLVSIGAIEGL